MTEAEFETAFAALAGNPPFPWQTALFNRFHEAREDNIPASCNLPTGLGKTSVIHVWLLALASGAKVPRRLVYVVNRRTVVDQTTNEVEKLRERLSDERVKDVENALWKLCALPREKDSVPLAISTLRGQFADNREWSADPARPAVICGTVDMIGSRLLFSGYGCGFKTRPLHAGFLGQDALIVHDEAHLEPAFQKLIEAIRDEQRREPAPLGEWTRLRVMELTATSRGDGEAFTLTDEDHKNVTVQKRVNATKALHLHELDDEKKLADVIAAKALTLKAKEGEDKGPAVLVFVRKVDDVEKIVGALKKAKQEVQQLTGTLRGLERDQLPAHPVFARFLPESNRPEGVTPQEGTVYLVCTSAGEVGVNISADHLVCDLSTFESMAQRFGRVNRFGDCPNTEIHVYHPTKFDAEKEPEVRRERTLALLKQLNKNASPSALGDLDAAARLAAFSPQPTILPTSDILFDVWALTSVREELPGRPPVDDYLHGLTDDPPQTAVAWRDDVELLTAEVLAANKLTAAEALDLFPLKPHETLSGPTYGKNKVFEQLETLAERDAALEPDKRRSAWVVKSDGSVVVVSLQDLVKKDKQNKPVLALGGRTVVLPPAAGGFAAGFLDGAVPRTEGIEYDVSEELFADKERTIRRRLRVRTGEPFDAKAEGMREICRIDFPAAGDDEDAVPPAWVWYERPGGADGEGSKKSATKNPITLEHHTKDVTDNTVRIVTALKLDDALVKAFTVAAQLHDLGKRREVWQRSIGNPKPKEWFAKSGKSWVAREITDYRHEFGSLLDAAEHADFLALKDEWKAFVLHVIATHHGYGRPHFPSDRAFDPGPKDRDAPIVAREVPQRFGRLQRQYGRWGLAYLESLLRAADYAASAKPSAYETKGGAE